MGFHSNNPKSVASTIPDDPDPTPMVQTQSGSVTQQAKRQEQKRIAGRTGRNSATIAGNTPIAEQNKKTILGG